MTDPMHQIEEFNHHRFDNYTAWLDREERKKQKIRKITFGEESSVYGYQQPCDIVFKKREKSPFKVDERSFTSGEVVSRNYDKNFAINNSDFEAVRTDPFHYPNTVGCTSKSHWDDYRSGSRNPYFIKESLRRPLDEELYNSVPESLVQKTMYNMKNRGPAKPMDEECAKILFAPDMAIPLERPKERTHTLDKIAGASPGFHSVTEWSTFRPVRQKCTRQTHSVPATIRESRSDRVLVTSTSDDGKSAHLRNQGGLAAKLGWAGTWSCEHGGGPGISEFSLIPPPLVTFW